jgi:hypothetical protein
MSVFGGIVDLRQGCEFLLELLHLLGIIGLLSLSHFGFKN